MAHAHAEAHDAATPPGEGDDLPHHGPHLEEPTSPAWLPYLGLALAGLLLVWWLSTPNATEEAAAAAAAASASASASAVEPPSGAPPSPPPGAPPNVHVAPRVDVNPRFKK